jgi:universal stress protein A
MIMANYRNVLVAVDFSDDSKAVINKALEIAARNQADLHLLHVVEYTSSMYAGDIPLPEDLNLDQDLAEQAAVRLKTLAQESSIPDAMQHVEIGIPKREIVRIAEACNADLIVVGSHGRHGLQLLLGSTANGVLHLAKCDVLAVRVGG